MFLAASPARAAEPVSVNVGITNVIADVSLFVADKRGYFAAENLKVRFVSFDAAARMIASLASGDLEVGGGGISAGLFNAVARGLGLKIVADKSTAAPGLATGALVVRKDLVDAGRYKSPRDLKGWKLAVPAPGTGTGTVLDRFLATVGLAIKDVDLIYLSFPQMVTALQNGGIDAGFLAEPSLTTVGSGGAALAQGATPPDFAPNPSAGWFAYTREFIPPASGPGPVVNDPAHPHVSNDEFRATGKQPTTSVADLNNPILQPWAREKVRARNETVLAGKQVFSQHAICWPMGVLGFLLEPMTRPMHFVQGPKEVVMITTSFNDVRHIYLADKHSDNLKPSWYGESIGHYEGDTLVVDTIGLNDRTFADGFETPHTTQLHVIERFHLIDNGEILEVNVHVEDPGAFTTPWDAIQRYRKFELVASKKSAAQNLVQLATPEDGPLTEAVCADNPDTFMGMAHKPLPEATKPDF